MVRGSLCPRADKSRRPGARVVEDSAPMSSPALGTRETVAASQVLERLLEIMPQDRVSVGWLHGELREHSFEMMAFLLALIGVLPGASVMIGVLMVIPAMGMMFSSAFTIPGVVARRSISTRQASYVIGRAIPLLRSWETGTHVRHGEALRYARPVVGALSLLLGITLLVPVPLSNVVPALAIAGLSLAAFERNLALLLVSGVAALGSLALTGITVVAASQAFSGFGF
jgi:hypothetical protein